MKKIIDELGVDQTAFDEPRPDQRERGGQYMYMQRSSRTDRSEHNVLISHLPLELLKFSHQGQSSYETCHIPTPKDSTLLCTTANYIYM